MTVSVNDPLNSVDATLKPILDQRERADKLFNRENCLLKCDDVPFIPKDVSF